MRLTKKSGYLDVHFHTFPAEIVKERLIAPPDEAEAAMEGLGLTTAMLSPSIYTYYTSQWSKEKWHGFCKDLCDWQLAKVKSNPIAFGSFVALPLPHVAETLEMIKYAQHHNLGKPDGYALSTCAGSHYLGDALFDDIWATLDDLKAVMFVHPCDPGSSPIDIKLYPAPTLEFPFDTARCIMQLIDRGIFARYPNIRWIFAHDGGAFPFLFQRVTGMIGNGFVVGADYNRIAEANNGKTIPEIFAAANVYLDTAQGMPAHHEVIRSMGVPASKILSGTDYPFVGKGPDYTHMIEVLKAPQYSSIYSDEELEGIKALNALNLFPRCKEEWAKAGLVKE